MRLYVDLGGHDAAGTSSGRVIKYDETPERGSETAFNGQYVIEIPEGASVQVGESPIIFPQSPSSITGEAAQQLLVRYPMYDHVLYNFFLENTDMGTVDLTAGTPTPTSANTTPSLGAAVSNPPTSRCKMGRTSGAGPVGMAPNRLVILSRSFSKTTDVYGCVISKTIDITSYNPVTPGTDEVLVWWRVAKLETSHDQNTDYSAGANTPALTKLVEINQEPLDFTVWVSNDDGATWYNTPLLEPVDLINPGTDLRIAFVNMGDDPLYLLGYCILFPDLP